MPSFFIDRPIFAWVVAILISLGGVLAILNLGVESYPNIAPPSVTVGASYPGASAETTEKAVTQVIEQQLTGIDHLLYFSSSSSASGRASITLTFESGTDPDIAQVQVQNKVALATPRLPSEVTQQGVVVAKANAGFLMVVALKSDNPNIDRDRLGDIVGSQVLDQIARVPGVGSTQQFGSEYAMRIWLNPDQLHGYGLSATQVLNAIRAQNVQFAAGSIGADPALPGQGFTATVSTEGRFTTPEQFAGIILRANPDGTTVKLGDVARISFGPGNYGFNTTVDGKPIGAFAIQLLPGANALNVATAVRGKMDELAPGFPPGVSWFSPYDSTTFVKISIDEVVNTLVEAIVLVFLVMLLFLQNLRATIIPTLVIPVALLGTFLGMLVLGFTINQLTLFGMVLAIGIVVDDAIVVIENIVRHMERGEPPMQAALTGVREIGFTVISITLSLVAVFAPLLFGNNMLIMLLREFSVTLTAAVVISALVSLTLTPALCAWMLTHEPERSRPPGRIEQAVENFDRKLLHVYQRALDWAMHHRRIMRWQPLTLLVLTFVLGFAVAKTAGGTFMPDEDTGQLQVDISADANISPAELTARALAVAKIMQADPAVLDQLTMLGRDGGGGGAVGNNAQMFVDLKPRGSGPGQRREGIKQVVERLSKQYDKLANVKVSVSAAQFLGGGGSGDKGGQYEFQLVSSNGGDLQPWTLKMVRQLRGMQQFRDVSSSFDQVGKQQLLRIDREAAARLHVGVGTIDSALYNAFGQRQVSQIYSDINQYAVVLSTGAAERVSPESLLDVRVRNEQGRMIPLSALATIEPNMSPLRVRHHNRLEAATISYNLAKDVTQDVGVKLVEQAAYAARLPAGMRVDFTGANQRLKQAQSNGMVLLLGSILAMYIVLGILYESLGHPLTILSTLPAAGAGAFLAMLVTQTQISMMAIIAILMLIGIVKKNAILMVDFALVAERERGLPAPEAIREAALVRFRPITMTTLVAMGAALPLAIGFGIGSEMRQPLGIAIVGGLLVSQLLTLLSTPAIYLWNYDRKIRKAARRERKAEKKRLKTLGKVQTAS